MRPKSPRGRECDAKARSQSRRSYRRGDPSCPFRSGPRPPGNPSVKEKTDSARVVVRSLCRHLDVVGMRFFQASRSNAHEFGALQLADRCRAAKTHRRLQAADELVHDRTERTAIGHLTLDALWYELVVGKHVIERVTILGIRRP